MSECQALTNSFNVIWVIYFLTTSFGTSRGGSRKFVEEKQSRSNMSEGCDKSITDSHESEPVAQHQWLCQAQQWSKVTASSPRPQCTKDCKSSRKFGTWNYLSGWVEMANEPKCVFELVDMFLRGMFWHVSHHLLPSHHSSWKMCGISIHLEEIC